MLSAQLKKEIEQGKLRDRLLRVYGNGPAEAVEQEKRLLGAITEFEKLYGEGRDISLFSAPGRTEIGGNHTDHQGGRVLAAGVNLDAVAVASKAPGGEVRVKSEGFPEDALNAADTGKKAGESGRSSALIRGICAGFKNAGYNVGGFYAYTSSRVLAGSGLSSSAAFEVLVGTAVNGLYCGGAVQPLAIAQIGRYAENEYYGKPCGLMDQAASAVGGFTMLDFFDSKNPRAEKIPFDFASCGDTLCIIDTKGTHQDLTPDYAAIPREMKLAAACFGKSVLSEVDEKDFFSNIPEVRSKAGDRAVLRAIHFFAENRRVTLEAQALKNSDFGEFKRLVNESGRSSFQYLQNVYSPSQVKEQGVSLAAALCEKLLAGRGGAWRVHGGGFAGTVQAYVPCGYFDEFKKYIESVFGEKTCHRLRVRPDGGIKII